MKKVKNVISIILVVMMCTVSMITANSASQSEIEKKSSETSEYLLTLNTPIVFPIGGEWMVTGLARSNKISNSFSEGYYKNAVDYVIDNGSAKLDRTKVTENARMIIALTSIGKDVTDVGGYNLLEPLYDFSYVKKQGLNGAIWTLIALDTLTYDIVPNTSYSDTTSRTKLIEYITGKQLTDGGWDRRNITSDPDITAMAIQALTPYYNKNNTVKNSVDKAITALSKLQQNNGGYSSIGKSNSNSCAQVIVALSSIGIDAENDERFIKNGHSVIDALMSFSVNNGFSYIGGDYDQMSTEQGYYALAAYQRFSSNKTSLYDMSDLLNPKNGLGDVTGDDSLDVMDCTEILKYLVQITDFSDHQCKVADFNHDKAISVRDATAIQKYIVMQ